MPIFILMFFFTATHTGELPVINELFQMNVRNHYITKIFCIVQQRNKCNALIKAYNFHRVRIKLKLLKNNNNKVFH